MRAEKKRELSDCSSFTVILCQVMNMSIEACYILKLYPFTSVDFQ